ncbi:MAG TPA: hypothetical protein VGW09_06150, partial [Nitrososphaeraceae archaeon]|nr:hypothetical protein [Nitrososphaeraceae archaeon]
SFVPPPLVGIVSNIDAIERYDAAIRWIQSQRHAVISNGPFYLDTYNPSGGIITIRAFRDPSYPFPQGYWSAYENPELAIIEEVVTQKYLSPGDQLNARVNVTIGGKPSNDAIVDYFLSDTDGKVILSGQAKPAENRSNTPSPHQQGVYEFSLNSSDTSKLKLGPNSLKIFANSEEAFRPDIFTVPLITFNREQ